MYIRIVTFRLQGMDPDDYEEMAERLAVTFRQWPGLTAKLWLADRETSTCGGVYVFESRAAADLSRSTPLFAGLTDHPSFTQLVVTEFATLTAPTLVTGSILASPS